MSNFKFKLNEAGVRDMLRLQAAAEACARCADDIKGRCGEGYIVTTHQGKTRANASVLAATEEARQDNLENNTLSKAVGK